METFFLTNESEIYTVAFFGAIALVAFWEGVLPRRTATQPLKTRWLGNFALAAINIGTIKFTIPVAVLGFSIIVAENQLGLFPALGLSSVFAIVLAVFAMDLARWTLHYLLHRMPPLWRLHRIHHSDHDYDFTVGLRFHPFEALFSAGFIFLVILLLGPPPIAVLFSELTISILGLVLHANGKTPAWIERYVRLIFVTPDMHRVHHSVIETEHNSNYGGMFSFWDRLFGTYVAAPAAGQIGMTIGLPDLRDPQCLKLGWMLLAPFRPMTARKPAAPSAEQVTSKPEG